MAHQEAKELVKESISIENSYRFDESKKKKGYLKMVEAVNTQPRDKVRKSQEVGLSSEKVKGSSRVSVNTQKRATLKLNDVQNVTSLID